MEGKTMTYARTTTVDAAPAGDTVRQSVLDVDTDLTGIYANLNTHETATTGIHGAGSGTLVSTTGTQTLTAKTISGATITGGTITGATFASPTLTAASDTAYGASWDNVTDISPSKNAVYDAIELYRFPRVTEISSHATPTINTDICDAVTITAQAAAITSMTTNLSGTPKNFQKLIIRIKDNGSPRAITWGASFFANGTTLPTTTVTSKLLTVGFIYDSVLSKWGCVAVQEE
jgi:hypothetical protein